MICCSYFKKNGKRNQFFWFAWKTKLFFFSKWYICSLEYNSKIHLHQTLISKFPLPLLTNKCYDAFHITENWLHFSSWRFDTETNVFKGDLKIKTNLRVNNSTCNKRIEKKCNNNVSKRLISSSGNSFNNNNKDTQKSSVTKNVVPF